MHPGNGVQALWLSAPKSQRFLRFAIAMPITDPRNRGDFQDKRKQCFCDLRLRCPSQTPEIAEISKTRESNAALRFKGAMESR